MVWAALRSRSRASSNAAAQKHANFRGNLRPSGLHCGLRDTKAGPEGPLGPDLQRADRNWPSMGLAFQTTRAGMLMSADRAQTAVIIRAMRSGVRFVAYCSGWLTKPSTYSATSTSSSAVHVSAHYGFSMAGARNQSTYLLTATQKSSMSSYCPSDHQIPRSTSGS